MIKWLVCVLWAGNDFDKNDLYAIDRAWCKRCNKYRVVY